MFVLRSLFWLSTLVMLLPPASENGQPPRLSLIHAAYAVRVLAQDVTGVCERNPEACATSREALLLLTAKLETGAGIVSAGIAAGQKDPAGEDAAAADRGTLTAADLQPDWALAKTGR